MRSSSNKLTSDRYDRAAGSYSEGRLDYSHHLIEYIAKASKLTSDSVVLDLGCGPGSIANKIAAYCGQVIAVDPSAQMLEEGRKNAPSNVTYIQGSSEDLSFIDQPLQLVTFGRSFHWMDRKKTLQKLNKMVAPTGTLAFAYVAPMSGTTRDHRWYYAVKRAANSLSDLKITGEQTAFGKAEKEVFVIMRSAFSSVEAYSHYEVTEWSFDQIVAFVRSRHRNSGDPTLQKKLAKRARFKRAAQWRSWLPKKQVQNLNLQKTQSGSGDIETVIRTALEPFSDTPWITINQQRVALAKRPQ